MVAAVVANGSDEPVRVGWGTARERAGGRMRCPRGQSGDVEITQVSRGAGGKQVAL